MHAKITRDLGDRLARLNHHLHRLSLKLRAEPPTMSRHKTNPLWSESPCPRSLVHPRPNNGGLGVLPLVRRAVEPLLSLTEAVDKLSDVAAVSGQPLVVRWACVEDLPAVVDLFAAVAEEGCWIRTEGPSRADRVVRLHGALGRTARRCMWLHCRADHRRAWLQPRVYAVTALGILVAAGWRGR